MIALIATILMALAWLGYETDWMRVRLPAGIEVPGNGYESCPIAYAQWLDTFAVYNTHNVSVLTERADWSSKVEYLGYTLSSNGEKPYGVYTIQISPGINEVLCGKAWLDKHWNDLKDYEPKVELNHAGVKYNMTIKDPAIMRSVVTALRAKPSKPYPKMSYSQNKNGGMKFSPMIPKAV